MSINEILIILMFLTFITLLFSGIPIAFVLMGTATFYAIAGYFADQYFNTLTGLNVDVLGMIVNRVFSLMESWTLIAVPMYIFMGLMLDQSGIAERLMLSLQELFGKVRGGLAITVAIIGIILAASTGIVGASVVLLGVLSIPIMMKQGYDKSLATGVVISSGTLGILIPPSIMLVIMADQLTLSVGDLFMGAVFPGLLLGVLFILYILVFGLIKPDVAPLAADRRPLSLNVIIDTLKAAVPPAALIFLVLGSIFFGFTTPTEASGLGAFGALAMAAFNKRVSYAVVKKVGLDTFKTCGYIFGIMVGAQAFALVLRMLGGDDFVQESILSLPFGPTGIIMTIVFIVFVLGFFLDWIEICLIILPLLSPVIKGLNLDIMGQGVLENPQLVWFAVLVAVVLQTSFLTPPVGFSIFFCQGICPPEIKLMDIYKGVVPFVILQLIGVAATIIFPGLVTWLPMVAYK